MKFLTSPPCGVFFTALLAADKSVYTAVELMLIDMFGDPIRRLEPQSFAHTRYYENEMGSNLLKGFLGFKPPFKINTLPQRKIQTRSIEWKTGVYRKNWFQRSVNIDPGYVSLYHAALATSKNFSHRFYLGKGVYGELTLLYRKDGWEELPWTYPDYKLSSVKGFLTECRNLLHDL
jgi:hypothetical protein